MIFNRFIGGAVLLALVVLQACSISMTPSSIPATVDSYYVGQFKVNALNAPATINQTFAEALKDKISRESRLAFTDESPDLEFNGTITTYSVEAKAPLPGERTAFNRLTITVSIEYTTHDDPKGSWTKSFSHFEDFDAEENLLQRQDELITVIFNQILEDIFNQAFNNW
jgi:hypothetical protein